MKSIKTVTFFGSSKGSAGDQNYNEAKKTAEAVAKLGITIVDGGGPGVMEAATLGAKKAKGKTEVVYYIPKEATEYEGKDARNLADKKYQEKNYIERTRKLLELGDAYIIFNGGTGTISEFGMAWGLARLYFGHHKPLILYGYFWNYIIGEFSRRMRIRAEELAVLTIVTNTQDAIKAIHQFDKMLEKNRSIHKHCTSAECRLFL